MLIFKAGETALFTYSLPHTLRTDNLQIIKIKARPIKDGEEITLTKHFNCHITVSLFGVLWSRYKLISNFKTSFLRSFLVS